MAVHHNHDQDDRRLDDTNSIQFTYKTEKKDHGSKKKKHTLINLQLIEKQNRETKKVTRQRIRRHSTEIVNLNMY